MRSAWTMASFMIDPRALGSMSMLILTQMVNYIDLTKPYRWTLEGHGTLDQMDRMFDGRGAPHGQSFLYMV